MGKTAITNNVRRLRFDADEMTQATLAEKADVTRQTIIAIEADKYSPSLELAFRIARAFQVPLEEVFQDPQVQALGMSIDLERPGGTTVRVAGSAIRLSATPPTYDLRPPLLGEHNEEVLSALGYDASAIEQLVKTEAV